MRTLTRPNTGGMRSPMTVNPSWTGARSSAPKADPRADKRAGNRTDSTDGEHRNDLEHVDEVERFRVHRENQVDPQHGADPRDETSDRE